MYTDARQIVELIKQRKDWFFDAQAAGTADDPKLFSGAEANRMIADEYEALLSEIQRNQTTGFQTEVK